MTATVSSKQVRQLREQSGAGMMECKRALEEAHGNFEKAHRLLKEKGLAKAEKKAARATGQGLIVSYVHQGRVGVLLELACETDFVAKCTDVQNLAKDVTLQIASMAPRYVAREHVPTEEAEKARSAFRAEGSSVDKRMEEWFSQACLMEQPFVKDAGQTVRDVLVQVISKVGENLVIRRFTRFELGEN